MPQILQDENFKWRKSKTQNHVITICKNNKVEIRTPYLDFGRLWDKKFYRQYRKSSSLQISKIDTSINLRVSDFIFVTNQKDMMTTPQLVKFINRERERGSGITQLFEVELHRRFADPFTTLILTLIGASIASRKVREDWVCILQWRWY